MEFIFAIVIAALQLILFFGHWILYKTLTQFFEIANPATLFTLKLSLGILSISFVLSSIISYRIINVFTRFFYTISSAWLGILLFLFLASILIWAIYLITANFSININQKILSGVLLGLAALIGIYGIINAGSVRVKTISVKLPNLPQAWQGKTAAWVSDVHLGQVRGKNFAQYITDKINAQNPDIVFIGGDLYDGGTAVDNLAEPFAHMPSKYGTYFITGNHEEFFDKNIYIDALKKLNIAVLDNKLINIDGLQIIGVNYQDTARKANFQAIMSEINFDKNLPVILLKHAPTDLDISQNLGINFEISGHTHKGQLFPINLVTSAVYRGNDYGFKKLGDMQLYVSSGAGTWGPPLRVATIPEIVVIKFE